MRITTEQLNKLYACSQDVALFERIFGKAVTVTAKNVQIAIQVKLELDWLFARVIETLPTKIEKEWWGLYKYLRNETNYFISNSRSWRRSTTLKLNRLETAGICLLAYAEEHNNYTKEKKNA